MQMRPWLGMALIALALNGTMPAHASASTVSPRAARLHESLLTLDTHLDTPASLDIPDWSIQTEHRYPDDRTQVDLPRMKRGGLDGGFWAIYTPQGPLDAAHYAKARDFAILRGISILHMVAADPAHFVLATEPEDAARIAALKKRVVYMSMENAYPLGEDISLAALFHRMGVREMGFAHFRNNQFADSSTDPGGPRWNGLSPLGRQLLAEMNRLGIIADGSHSSDAVLDQMLAYSKAPVILSHSGCKAVYDHPRNVDDARLRALAAKGGVIQINSYGNYLRAVKPNPSRDAALRLLFSRNGEGPMTAGERTAFLAQWKAIEARYPDTDRPTFDDFMRHLLHALTVVGPDHVGIGLDWDGGGGVAGMEDVSTIPRITQALLTAGYSPADIAKIWSGNVLRVLAAVKAEAAREQAAEPAG